MWSATAQMPSPPRRRAPAADGRSGVRIARRALAGCRPSSAGRHSRSRRPPSGAAYPTSRARREARVPPPTERPPVCVRWSVVLPAGLVSVPWDRLMPASVAHAGVRSARRRMADGSSIAGAREAPPERRTSRQPSADRRTRKGGMRGCGATERGVEHTQSDREGASQHTH